MAAQQDSDRVTVVLVHGTFHGAWCWDPVLSRLAARGVRAVAVELRPARPGAGSLLDHDVEVVERTIAAVGGRVVLCGHSRAGLVIAATERDEVAHAVYVAALLPRTAAGPDETSALTPLAREAVGLCNDELHLEAEAAVRLFYDDCEPEDARRSSTQLVAEPLDHHPALRTGKWGRVPTTYIVCDDDRAVAPEYQRAAADRCDHTVRLASGHSPFLSRPDDVAGCLASIVSGIC